MAPILANRPCNGLITAPTPATRAAVPRPHARFHDLWPALALGLTGLVWLAGTTLAGVGAGSVGTGSVGMGSVGMGSAGTGGQLLVIGPPSLDPDSVNSIIWQAGGAVMGTGGLPNIAIAAADRPDFARALTVAGAWLVLPSPRLLGCFSTGAGTQ